jgi:hypothetical protein
MAIFSLILVSCYPVVDVLVGRIGNRPTSAAATDVVAQATKNDVSLQRFFAGAACGNGLDGHWSILSFLEIKNGRLM